MTGIRFWGWERRRSAIGLVVAALVVGAAAGCGGSTSDTTEPTSKSRPSGTTASTSPAKTPTTLLDISSIKAVTNGPTEPSVFTIDSPKKILTIVTYHWNNATGATPGTIGLRSSDGKLYGPWPTTGSPGQGGVPNAYWTATPNEVIPAGTYTVVDSDPASWAWTPDTGGRGMVVVTGS